MPKKIKAVMSRPKEIRFIPKKTITIEGKEYECDPGNLGLIEGVTVVFPKVMACSNQLNDLIESGNPEELVKKNRELYECCKEFILGVFSEEEYAEIFANRKTSASEHLIFCSQVYDHIMRERQRYIEDVYLRGLS